MPVRSVDLHRYPLPRAVAGKRFDATLNLVGNSPEEIGHLVDLIACGTFVRTPTSGPGNAGPQGALCHELCSLGDLTGSGTSRSVSSIVQIVSIVAC